MQPNIELGIWPLFSHSLADDKQSLNLSRKYIQGPGLSVSACRATGDKVPVPSPGKQIASMS